MVSAIRDFSIEALGSASANEPISPEGPVGSTGYRGQFSGNSHRYIVDGVMAARAGIIDSNDGVPLIPPFLVTENGYWYFNTLPTSRFITQIEAHFLQDTTASNYGLNNEDQLLVVTAGVTDVDLSVDRSAVASPWTFRIGGVDTAIECPQNLEITLTATFTNANLHLVVNDGSSDILDENVVTTGYPTEFIIGTSRIRSNSNSPGGGSPATGDRLIAVNQMVVDLTPYIVTPNLPDGTVGEAYLAALVTDGDPGAYAVVEGSLPPGLSIDPGSGEITGTPTDADVYSFTIGYTETESGLPGAREYELTISGAVAPAAWTATLNGSTICGGECADLQVDACLKVPPVGLGVPALRVEDQTYPQRDGVEHFADWYEPRIITMEASIGGSSAGCGCESDAHAAARRVASAWARQCDDVELVIRPDVCTDPEDREISGPFGIIGRPRVADITWRRGKTQIADALLRFDAVDHRIYILDADGTPGSGAECATISAPEEIAYTEAVADTLPYHHWPLDFPNLGIQDAVGYLPPVQIGSANDVIGSFDSAPISSLPGSSGLPGIPTQVPPISFGLSLSAIQGPAIHDGRPWSAAYTSGMVGWWQETPVGALTTGSAIVLDGSTDYQIGVNASGQITPVISFGSGDVAMNAATQAAFGFTDTYHGQPVMILLVFVSGTLYIFAAHDASSSPFLIQTVVGSGLPAVAGTPSLTAFSAKISNIMSGMNNYTATPEADGEDIMAALAPYGFSTPSSQVTLPDVGQLCVPIRVTFESGVNPGAVYIFKADGTYVGIAYRAFGADYGPSLLDTDAGSATRFFGTIDATNDITGNPFLNVAPGETLNVFGGGDVTICFRPAVIST